MLLTPASELDAPLQVQYYMFKDPSAFFGAGRNPALLNTLTLDQLDLLPGSILTCTEQTVAPHSYKFFATPPPDAVCSFTYLGMCKLLEVLKLLGQNFSAMTRELMLLLEKPLG